MYVKHLFSAKGQEKQDPFPSQKGQKDHRSRWPHQYNQFLVIWKSLPVPTDGRSPGSQILTYRRLPNFHQWPHLALAIYSLLTVTRSHRFCTCFPFNLRPQDLSPAPGASAPAVCLIQLCFYFNLFHGAVSIVSSRSPSFRAPREPDGSLRKNSRPSAAGDLICRLRRQKCKVKKKFGYFASYR